jgi:RNA polymerase sigma-70 factor (ECF subfamily)
MTGDPSAARFPTTCWSRIVAARGPVTDEAREALSQLCAAYWYPLYAFIRRTGHGPEEALDLTQGYFARLLERGNVAAADAAKGRFRAFLRADCGRFLADRRAHDRAAKRGGGVAPPAIDARDAEGQYQLEPAHEHNPERLFEREWALALLEGVLATVRREYETSGRGETFEVLKGVLEAGSSPISQAEMAARLGTSEAAVQVAVHRLRKRYREALRAAIAATVADESEADDELKALFAALGP